MKPLFVLSICSFLVAECLGQNLLFIPDTISGSTITLTMQEGTHSFVAGTQSSTMGVNGDVLGPTVLLQHGEEINFEVVNQLQDTTTMHWHGMHVSPENDGGPHSIILPGETWSPNFTVLDKAATYWYHPHLHHKTNLHVSKGIAGLIIVRDEEEAALDLPRTYGVDDFPIVMQTKALDADNQILPHSNNDDLVLVNATAEAFVEVPAQLVRLRLLNGASQRSFYLGLSDGATFQQIASDGGLLEAPYVTNRLLISPGERAEILVDFAGMEGTSTALLSYASELPNGIYGSTNPGMNPAMNMDGYDPNPINGADFTLLDFNVTAALPNAVTAAPTTLATVTPWASSSADITRSLTFSPATMGMNQLNGGFLINNSSFDMGVVNYTVPLDNIEIWELYNQSAIAHPFHIHDVQFTILSRNGVVPPPNERGWKDVVLVQHLETVRFIAKFEDFANQDVPYMYHCHLLTHEDGGMMGQFIVSDGLGTSEAGTQDIGVSVFPNPNNGEVHIRFTGEVPNIAVYDAQGRCIKPHLTTSNNLCTLDGLTPGTWVLRIETLEGVNTHKVVVE